MDKRYFLLSNTKHLFSVSAPALILTASVDGISRNSESVENTFAEHVRTTEFQTPEEEMTGFKLPEGFEISLFVSEPDITKPINMESDDQDRLWVTQVTSRLKKKVLEPVYNSVKNRLKINSVSTCL